jgi:hypothetical protein
MPSPSQEFAGRSVRELLQLQGRIVAELRCRTIVRTGNAPLGDYAEWLFAKAFGWKLEENSAAGFDAGYGERRFQIKARRLTASGRGTRQLSVIRNLQAAHFDSLAAVLFAEDYSVWRAALVPREVVVARATQTPHVNGWRFILKDEVWSVPGVEDVTARLKVAEASD